MSKDRLKSPRLRLFVALELPSATRDQIAIWQRTLVASGGGELRNGNTAALHLTLAFMGFRFEKELDAIEAALRTVTPPPVALTFSSTPVPKPPTRPRLYAVEVEPVDALTELRAEVVRVLTEKAGFVDDSRPYWPHVTLCRVKSSVKHHHAINPLPEAPSGLATPASAAALTLFSSDLQPSGAVHTALWSRPLPPISV